MFEKGDEGIISSSTIGKSSNNNGSG